MKCPRCKADNDETRRFCGACGAPLGVTCPSCGFANEPGVRFCGGCGASLVKPSEQDIEGPSLKPVPSAPPGELRQVTVLFADLSGFTKLSSERDPEEAHGLLARFFEAVDGVIERYGGTIDKHIGDNVMAVFGAPVAHGNDPERAVRAAGDIHEAMSKLGDELEVPLKAHIGVASGQVMASGTGSARHQEYTVTGESVNLASRLDDMAEPGETLIPDAVYRAVADLVEVEEAGDVTVKGLEKPVRAWRVRALKGERPTETGRPFVGRRAELRQFTGVIEACRETGSGQALYVRGEAGIGKTRLVEEFQSLAKGRGFACHTGLVLDFGVGKGQDAIGSIARSFLGIPPGSDKAFRRAQAEQGLADGLIGSDHRVFLNDLLDLPQPTELRALYDAMDNTTRNRGKQATVATLLKGAAARQPVLVTVEGVHWADTLTLDHLAAMTSAVAECPAVLVMTSRVEGDPLDQAWRSATRMSALMTIDLAPLRKDEAIALAGEFIDATTRFALRCVERAEGNPLFLEQLLRSAEESEDEDVPASIQSLVLARIDRLPPADKKALQAAAVIGQRFSLDPLQHLLDEPDYRCTGLVEHYLVRPEGEDYLFAHALIQEGVYASLLKARKRELHRRAAEWFGDSDPVLRAEHLDRAEDSAAPQAYLEAARSESGTYRYDRASRLVERGLELARDREDKYALTCLRGELLHDLGSIAESIAAYRGALDIADDDVERCRAWIGLAAGMRVKDEYDEAVAALDKAEKAATNHGLTVELARIHHLRGNLYFPLGNIDGCREQHELALKYARQAGSPESEAQALSGLGDAEYARGRVLTAHDYFRRCVELCREHGFGRVEVANLSMVARTRFYFNELQGVLDDYLAAVEDAARVGHHRAELIAQLGAALTLLDMAETAHAKEHLKEVRALARHLGARRFEAWHLTFTANILRAEGRRTEALELLEQAMAISRETGTGYTGPRVLGQLALTTDDPPARRKALDEGERILRAGSIGPNHFGFYRDAMGAALSVSDWDGVDRYAAALEEYTRPEPLPWTDFFIARGRALAAYGRGERDDATMQELKRLRDEAERVGLNSALPAIEEALAGA